MANLEMAALILLAAFLLLSIYTVPIASADTGIGLYATTNAETIMEGKESCITYKLYNQFDIDVMGVLNPAGEIENMTTRIDPPIAVPGRTSYNEGIERKICLMKDNIHSDCLVGEAFCRTCADVDYAGSVVASIIPSSDTTVDVGGGASSQPLRVTVRCNQSPPLSLGPLLILAALLLVGSAILFERSWKRRNEMHRMGELYLKKTHSEIFGRLFIKGRKKRYGK